ncbi:hypothetical protein HMPREF1128_1254 [Haemophilus sputorum HK 2154]|nr:hypothetical protein HMPREF1128_1254 [Haemophilus sputorum HK 2154]
MNWLKNYKPKFVKFNQKMTACEQYKACKRSVLLDNLPLF